MSARMMPGITRMCSAYSLGMMMSPGKSPPNSAQCIQVPMTGIPIVIPENAARRPVPREQVVGQRVAEEPFEHCQDQQ